MSEANGDIAAVAVKLAMFDEKIHVFSKLVTIEKPRMTKTE
jgi:hypothetical protein